MSHRRWINLWWAPDFVGDSSDTDDSTATAEFVGNSLLCFGVLFGLFFVHMALASGVEAFWLSKVGKWLGSYHRRHACTGVNVDVTFAIQ